MSHPQPTAPKGYPIALLSAVILSTSAIFVRHRTGIHIVMGVFTAGGTVYEHPDPGQFADPLGGGDIALV